ncbi:hypothetical protein K6W21_04740 [Burkholderia latens]|uniref:hypothetical protein n=1 Tax=Burkholderia latens TaxID=488446 RepID=UPI001C94AAC0|nr:hypothetical protein [Burkholderia latens]MBY4693399.1 hypothetical protein [Burkholderia latens]
MTSQQQQPGKQTDEKKPAGKPDDGQSTFETDISETGDDGTTVRQAEVREDDLSEVKPPSAPSR